MRLTHLAQMKVILSVSAKKSSTYLDASAARWGCMLSPSFCPRLYSLACPAAAAALPSFAGLTPPLLFTLDTFVIGAPAWFALIWPSPMLGKPTMLDPTLFLGETLCTLGCTSVVPVPDIAPTGLFMNDEVLFVFV